LLKSFATEGTESTEFITKKLTVFSFFTGFKFYISVISVANKFLRSYQLCQ